MKTKVNEEIGPFIHLGATSVDILDTALSCRMRDVTQNVVLPEIKQLEKLGIENPTAFFENPANYCGLAAIKSMRLAQKYRDLM